jgi:hypothetical protein
MKTRGCSAHVRQTPNLTCRASQTSGIRSLLEARVVIYVRYEVFTAVTMKNSVFWDIET